MNCDYCGKKTAFLEDLDYCSVCMDCLGEIEEQDNLDISADYDKDETRKKE
jgi:hypothetical protein